VDLGKTFSGIQAGAQLDFAKTNLQVYDVTLMTLFNNVLKLFNIIDYSLLTMPFAS